MLIYEDLASLTPYMHTAEDTVGTSLNSPALLEGNARLAAAAIATLAGLADGTENGIFIRGDANADGTVDVSDPLFVLLHLFAEGPAPVCLDAADADDSGGIGLGDAVRILSMLFGGKGGLPAPGGACGRDLTPDALACSTQPACYGTE